MKTYVRSATMKTFLFAFLMLITFQFSCKVNADDSIDVPEGVPDLFIGKWQLMSVGFQDATTPWRVDTYTENDKNNNFISFEKSGHFVASHQPKGKDTGSSAGVYSVIKSNITFTVVSGDDEMTDEGTYKIITLADNSLVYQQSDAEFRQVFTFKRF
jgi:hypothetical protein